MNIAHILPKNVDNLLRKCKINKWLIYVYLSNFNNKYNYEMLG